MEIAKCKCGGLPREIRSGLGCYVYCSRCGHETANHGYISDAIYEWNQTMNAQDTQARKAMYEKVKYFSYHGQHIPDYMITGILNYLVDRVQPGDFLSSIITNDLKSACHYADANNMWLIPVYVAFFYNQAPSTCWGSKERMEQWLSEREEPQHHFPTFAEDGYATVVRKYNEMTNQIRHGKTLSEDEDKWYRWVDEKLADWNTDIL